MRTHFDSVFIWKHEVSNKLLPISLQTISENTGQLPLTKTDRHLKGISSDSIANSTELSETPSREKGLVEWRQCLTLPRHCSPHTSSSQLDNNSCVPSSKAALLLNKKMKNYMHHSILCSKQGFFFIFSIVNSLCIFITHKYLANIPSYLLNKITFNTVLCWAVYAGSYTIQSLFFDNNYELSISILILRSPRRPIQVLLKYIAAVSRVNK